MVDVARFFLAFTMEESCGKCTFCREGTRHLYDILSCIVHGQGKVEDLALLEQVAHGVKAGSLCGLGQTAPNPSFPHCATFRRVRRSHRKQALSGWRLQAVGAGPLRQRLPAEVDIPTWLRSSLKGNTSKPSRCIAARIPLCCCAAACARRCARLVAAGARLTSRLPFAKSSDSWRSRNDIPGRHPGWKSQGRTRSRRRSGPAGLTAALRLAQKGYRSLYLKSCLSLAG